MLVLLPVNAGSVVCFRSVFIAEPVQDSGEFSSVGFTFSQVKFKLCNFGWIAKQFWHAYEMSVHHLTPIFSLTFAFKFVLHGGSQYKFHTWCALMLCFLDDFH